MDMNVLDKFVDAIKPKQEDRKNTYNATVSQIDGEGTVWVCVAGSDKETPTAEIASEVKKGDEVIVEWRNNKLYVLGNYSNPSAGTIRVKQVERAARVAGEAAENAVADAGIAKAAAASAQESAAEAKKDADTARNAADGAIDGLSLVQRVVEVANWIAEHGKYITTEDETPIQGKYYFIYNPNTQTYSVVEPQEGDNPHENGWLEIESIDESVSNFITTHMALVADGLVLRNGNTRVDLSTTDGVVLWANGKKLATYGQDAIIGDEMGFHLKATATELAFYDYRTKVAYISGDKLYITKSVVLQQMDVGRPAGEIDPQSAVPVSNPTGDPQSQGYYEYNAETGYFLTTDTSVVVGKTYYTVKLGKGQWSWKVHDIQGSNNLYLKWLG